MNESSTGAAAPEQAPGLAAGTRRQIGVVTGAVLLMYLGQMALNPVIAPLARTLRLSDVSVGAIISLAAVTVVLTSQAWGRRSVRTGRKPVLLFSMGLGAASMIAFTVAAWLGAEGVLGGWPLLIILLLTRGLLFGFAIAAVMPTAQAFIADVTDTEADRVKGMAGLGAAQGLAMVLGSVVGGLLAGFGILVALIAVPVILAVGFVVVATGVREGDHALIPDPPRLSPFDARLWPFLLVTFGLVTSMGLVQVITGFIVQDRFHLTARATGMVNGGVLLAAGVGMILAQAVIVPRSGWGPVRLLRVGAVVALVGFLAMLPTLPLPVLVVAVGLIGLGMGIALPGCTAGPSLVVGKAEQGGLAGLVGATMALTYVVAPLLGTSLYAADPILPIVLSVIDLAVMTVLLLVHPRLRSVAR